MKSPPRAPTHRLAYLDALRGFAALYVVIYHVCLIPDPALTIPHGLRELVGFGGSGVTLFFIISGFSMCLTWQRHAGEPSPVRSFYLSRFTRIAPLFYAWLVLALVRDFVFKGASGQHTPIEIGANLLFVFNLYEPFQTGIVWASWTLGVEMLFYAAFPLIKRTGFTTLPKTSLLLAASLIVVAVARNSASFETGVAGSLLRTLFDGVGFLFALPVFLAGIVTYHAHELLQAKAKVLSRFWQARLLLPAALGILVSLALYHPASAVWYYAAAAGYSMLLLAFSAWERNVAVNPTTCYLGTISYSLYLNHPTLVYILIPVYSGLYKLGLGSLLAFLLCASATIALLVPISHMTFRLIEAPGMNWARKYNKR